MGVTSIRNPIDKTDFASEVVEVGVERLIREAGGLGRGGVGGAGGEGEERESGVKLA